MGQLPDGTICGDVYGPDIKAGENCLAAGEMHYYLENN